MQFTDLENMVGKQITKDMIFKPNPFVMESGFEDPNVPYRIRCIVKDIITEINASLLYIWFINGATYIDVNAYPITDGQNICIRVTVTTNYGHNIIDFPMLHDENYVITEENIKFHEVLIHTLRRELKSFITLLKINTPKIYLHNFGYGLPSYEEYIQCLVSQEAPHIDTGVPLNNWVAYVTAAMIATNYYKQSPQKFYLGYNQNPLIELPNTIGNRYVYTKNMDDEEMLVVPPYKLYEAALTCINNGVDVMSAFVAVNAPIIASSMAPILDFKGFANNIIQFIAEGITLDVEDLDNVSSDPFIHIKLARPLDIYDTNNLLKIDR